MEPIFFPTAADLRAWFEANHDKIPALQVGYYKVGSGRPSISYKESVDLALCFGWIDSVRHSIDVESYTNRFTPRKPRSIWSAVNIKRISELIEQGQVHPAGLKAFAERDPARQNQYSGEQQNIALPDEYEAQFRANAAAWEHFQQRPPSYRRPAIWWVISAKQEATRRKRLATLIEDSANGRKIGPLTRKNEKQDGTS